MVATRKRAAAAVEAAAGETANKFKRSKSDEGSRRRQSTGSPACSSPAEQAPVSTAKLGSARVTKSGGHSVDARYGALASSCCCPTRLPPIHRSVCARPCCRPALQAVVAQPTSGQRVLHPARPSPRQPLLRSRCRPAARRRAQPRQLARLKGRARRRLRRCARPVRDGATR